MKPTVLISSTMLATIMVLGLGQASQVLSTPATVKSIVNSEAQMLFPSNLSVRPPCTDTNGAQYECPKFVMPQDSAE